MNQPIIGCVQLNSQANVDDNLTIIEAAITQAAKQGVHLLVLPENACRMGNQFELSERFDEISKWYADLALKHKLYLIAGTLPCPYRPNGALTAKGKLRQVSQAFAPDSKLIARYDKIHLFRAQVDDNTGSYDEGKTFEPGDTTVIANCDMQNLMGVDVNINHKVLNIGLMICFDLRFPALAQRLRQAGADILTAPSAFTYQTGQAHWQSLLKARALDSQCMVVGAAQGGEHVYGHAKNRQTWGHSAIVNANGELMVALPTNAVQNKDDSKAEKNNKFSLITCTFDQVLQQEFRQNLPIYDCHRLA